MASRAPRTVLTRLRGAGIALAALALAGSGGPAPLELESLSGGRVQLAPREGRALVVHFFATWCPTCGEEIAELLGSGARCGGAVEIALVDVDEDAETVHRFLAAHQVEQAPLLDRGGRAWRATTGGRGLPANLIWRGSERRVEVGPRSGRAWRDLLAELGCAGTIPRP